LKKVYNSNAINKFKRFKNIFANNKNTIDCKIFNFLRLTNNNFKNLIKINNNKVKIKEKKTKNNAKIIDNKYKDTKYKDKNNNNKNKNNNNNVKNKVNYKIVEISN